MTKGIFRRCALGVLAAALAATASAAGGDPIFKRHEIVMVPKKAAPEDASSAGALSAGGANEMPKVARIFQSLSSLQGIEYYSQSRKKMAVLYKRCYYVDDPKTRVPVPDRFDLAASGEACYYLQDDNSLGVTVYRAQYSQTADSVTLDARNVDALKVGPFTAVPPEGIHLVLTATDRGPFLKVEMLMEADMRKITFAESFVDRSFRERIGAVFKWFENEYNKE